MHVLHVITALVVLGLFAYLAVALLDPERFE